MSRPWLRAASYFPIYVLLVVLASGLWSRPVLLAACYAVLGGLMLLRWHKRSDVGFVLLAGVLGPLGELIAIHSGAWQYARPWLGIPIWLPLAWGVTALYLKKTIEALTER